jgi:hypothetical protein
MKLPFKSFRVGPVHYRQELVKCGKPNCKCCPHGPYWYAYWHAGIMLRKKYVGKWLTPELRQLAPPGCT